MTDWVRFHRELRQGDKRGLSRATRFIYMELSQEARPRRGVVFLPAGMPDVDGVCDILGGNRKEVIESIRDLTKDPDPMIRFVDIEGKRALVIIKWAEWNPADPTGSERQARYRNARRNGTSDGGGNGQESHSIVTVTEPRARAPLSSPLLSVSDHGSKSEEGIAAGRVEDEPPERPSEVRVIAEAPGGRRQGRGDAVPPARVELDPAMPITQAMRDAASMAGIPDAEVDSAFVEWKAQKRSLGWTSADWSAQWQADVGRVAARRRSQRDADGLARARKPPVQTDGPAGRQWKSGLGNGD